MDLFDGDVVATDQSADEHAPIKRMNGGVASTLTTVPNAEFDEVVARIMCVRPTPIFAFLSCRLIPCTQHSVNPQTALAELPNALLRRESDGSTLLHVIAGWSRCQDLVTQLLLAGVPVDVEVGR